MNVHISALSVLLQAILVMHLWIQNIYSIQFSIQFRNKGVSTKKFLSHFADFGCEEVGGFSESVKKENLRQKPFFNLIFKLLLKFAEDWCICHAQTYKYYMLVFFASVIIFPSVAWSEILLKGAAADMRYFARSKFFRSQVHKKNFSLIWQVVSELGYIFCQER